MGRRMNAASRIAGAALLAAALLAGCSNPLLNVVKDTAQKTTANLSTLTLRGAGGAEVALSPAFSADIFSYRALVNRAVGTVAVHVNLADTGAQWKVNDVPVSSQGVAVALAIGDNVIPVEVTSASGLVQKKYSLTVTRGSIRQLSGGAWYSLVLKGDGTVWAWGQNDSGQLGDGTTTDRAAPVRVSGVVEVVSVSSAYMHTVALKKDGTVWTWGQNWNGQLGDGWSSDGRSPVQVTSLTGITAVAAGWNNTLALRSDGTVWAWGGNWNGQLGDGTRTTRALPVKVNGLPGKAVAIAAGESFSLALLIDGTVWAWGTNWTGQLGDGNVNGDQLTPVQVSGLTGIEAIAAGQRFSAALKDDGTVWTWGSNANGALGNSGAADPSSTPVQVTGLTGVTAIAAAGAHVVALKGDGTVWGWGNNWNGELGDGTVIDRPTPIAIHFPSAVLVGAAPYCTLASTTDDRVFFCGQVYDRSLHNVGSPVQSQGMSSATSIAAGGMSSVALKSDGTVWAWGNNSWGQLAADITTDKASAQQISGLAGVTAVGAGWVQTVVLKNDQTVWAWGGNFAGQVGDGTTTSRSMPVAVSGLTGITSLSIGGHHCLARKNDGTVWAWGGNWNGQLGINSTASQSTPVQVSAFTNSTTMAGGENHTLAVITGAVWACGWNSRGQLGDGTTTDRSTPVQVAGLSGTITGVSAGSQHSLALRSDGTVWAWGANDKGQLGNGTFDDSHSPVQVIGLSGITAISAGYNFNIALKNDGTVWAWGENTDSQLGDGNIANRMVPVKVSGLTGVTAIDTGDSQHCLAIKADGTVWAWGANGSGQVGNGIISDQFVPAQVLLP